MERVFPIPTKFPLAFVLDLKIARIRSFRFLYQKKKFTYEVFSNLLIGINPRSLPLRNEEILLLELHPVLVTLPPTKR